MTTNNTKGEKMKTIQYRLTVNETQQVETLDSREDVDRMAAQIRKAHGSWGADVTFTLERITTEQLPLE